MSVTLKRKSNINDIYNIGHVNIDLKDIIKEIQVDKKDDIIYFEKWYDLDKSK
jgi:hypothetical protein